jgi:GTP-binding protein HflX
VPVSALQGDGIESLLRMIEAELDRTLIAVDVHLRYEQGGFVSRAYEAGVVDQVDHEGSAIRLKARLPRELAMEIEQAAIRPPRRTRRKTAAPVSNDPPPS